MTRKEFSHKLADFYEALHDSENELKDVRLKIIMEDNPERKAWFIAAQERLLREEDLEDKLKRFISQNT